MSEVWNHFFMASNGLSVTCNHCGKFMKRSDSSTKSMWGHLKAFHADLVGEETFRLKRTRRMRGEGGGGGSKTASAKTPKSVDGKSIGGGKTRKKLASPEATMTSCSSGSSFSSASSSSGGEELDELEGPSEFSSRASSQEVGECVERTLCVDMEEMKGEMEERKDEDEEEERRKNVLTPPMTVASVKREGVVAKPEVRETPTQPYVKRKRPHHREQQQQQANERAEEPTSQTASIAVNQQSAAAAAEQQNGAVVKPPPSPTMSVSCHGASSANAIPCSASSAFSKYSTAALLMDSCLGNGGCSVGTTSPSHGAEAPKQYSKEASQQSQLQPQPLPAPRPKYGLEAITGLDTTAHLATDPEMLANLEVAVTMNRLVNEYHHQQQKNNLNAVQAQQVQNVHQQQQKTTQNGSGQHQQNILGQQLSGQQLNELLAIYAASVTASALQHQQQKGTDQQQLVAQQAAAAVSWLYNWEWMAAATAAASTQQQQKPVNGLNMSGGPMSKKVGSGVQQQSVNGRSIAPVNGAVTNNCANSNNNNNGLNMMSAGLPLLSALSLGGKMGGNVAKFAGGNNGAVNAEAVQPKSGLDNNNSLANGMETKQNQQQQNTNHHQLAQKRKSPAEERDCAASLLVLADTASTAAVEQQQRGSASPPKSRKMGELCKKKQQQQQHQQDNHTDGCCSGADGAGEALAESLVLYGMHRIAMELQLSYSVHGNKAGRAEYAFYCTNTGTANANVQRMVTLTESADQVLHIREYANGTVVAEECWPKSAEPGTLLLSLRDKCQRRLCA